MSTHVRCQEHRKDGVKWVDRHVIMNTIVTSALGYVDGCFSRDHNRYHAASKQSLVSTGGHLNSLHIVKPTEGMISASLHRCTVQSRTVTRMYGTPSI